MNQKQPSKKIEHEIDVLQGDAAKQKIYSSERAFLNESDAKAGFEAAAGRLFTVNSWSDISAFTATFVHHDQTGEAQVARIPQKGDYIQIKLPGPTPKYWVRVVACEHKPDLAEFTVQPSEDPLEDAKESDQEKTKHFFREDARSIFRVERQGTTIKAYEIGLDEFINNQGKEAGGNALINTVVSTVGWLFYQEIQWKALTDYLVGID
jgi:hypothetical protein